MGVAGGGDGGGNWSGTAFYASSGYSGVANTGGGGGGAACPSGTNYSGGAGGSGIVVIRYPATFAAASATTGSPAIYTSNGYRIYVWTSSGSITI
jgi:hypothetical protein